MPIKIKCVVWVLGSNRSYIIIKYINVMVVWKFIEFVFYECVMRAVEKMQIGEKN